MSASIGDDLRKGLGAFVQVLDGVGEIERTATSVLAKADTIVEHVSDPNTIGRVAAAALGGALHAVNQEVQAAATQPRAKSVARKPTSGTVSNVLLCRSHGTLPWKCTLVCGRCGRVSQVLDRKAPRFAPDDCPCGVRLLPGAPDEAFSARPICTACFTGIAASCHGAAKAPRKGPS